MTVRSNYQLQTDRLIAHHPDAVVSDGAVHRRNQILVPADQSESARDAVAGLLAEVETFDEIGVHRLWLRPSATVDAAELAEQLRDRGIRATPNHILRGESEYLDDPFSAPMPCEPIGAPVLTHGGRIITVAILDTGITPHPWFTRTSWWSSVTSDQLDPIPLSADDESADQSGHGTFVAGVVMQRAPNAQLWNDRVLDTVGICDELGLLQGLHRIRRREKATGTRVDIVNLSLGGYAHADHPSPLVAESLRKFGGHTVIVASAGNNSSSRLYWPAAFKDCVAVGAKAPFSNHGWWVDASAPAVDLVGPYPWRRADGAVELGYARWNGSVFGAPAAVGVIAHLAGTRDMTAREAAEILLGPMDRQADPEYGIEIDGTPAAFTRPITPTVLHDYYTGLGDYTQAIPEQPFIGTGGDGFPSGDDSFEISIYLSDERAHLSVERAVEEWLATAHLEIGEKDDPVIGSWFRRMKAKARELSKTPVAVEAVKVATHSVESRLVQAQDAAVTAQLLQSLGPVLVALQSTEEAVIRAQSLLIVKVSGSLVVHQLTAAQQFELDHRPELALRPGEILLVLGIPESPPLA